MGTSAFGFVSTQIVWILVHIHIRFYSIYLKYIQLFLVPTRDQVVKILSVHPFLLWIKGPWSFPEGDWSVRPYSFKIPLSTFGDKGFGTQAFNVWILKPTEHIIGQLIFNQWQCFAKFERMQCINLCINKTWQLVNSFEREL